MKKIKLPLSLVKAVCVAAVLLGIFGLVAGRWIVGLCMLLGSYLLEKSLYRCPQCGAPLDMKKPLPSGAHCPSCHAPLKGTA